MKKNLGHSIYSHHFVTNRRGKSGSVIYTHTHTHTHIYIYIYIYNCFFTNCIQWVSLYGQCHKNIHFRVSQVRISESHYIAYASFILVKLGCFHSFSLYRSRKELLDKVTNCVVPATKLEKFIARVFRTVLALGQKSFSVN